MKKILLFLLLPFSFVANAQESKSYDYLIIGEDTTFCYISELIRAGGNVTTIIYTNIDGTNKQKITKSADIIKIKTISVGGYVMDFLPLKLDKPDAYHRHMERKIDGKIIVYNHIGLSAETTKKGKRLFFISAGGNPHYFVKLDNSYYDINKKSIKGIIIPFLNKCPDFKKEFTDEITGKNLEAAVTYYNKVCK